MSPSSRYWIAVSLLIMLIASTAWAEDAAWEGGLSLEWTDGTPGVQTNWVGAVLPGAADTALFTAAGIAADKTITVASPVTVAGLKTDGIAGDLTISGSPLTLSSIEGAGANKKDLKITNDIVLAADGTIYRRDNTEHFLTLEGVISGDHALTITNDSTSNWRAIRLYGANTYSGGTSVKGRIDYKAGAFGTGAISLHGTADLAPVGGAILPNDLDTSGGLPILNNATVATGIISGTGPLRVNTATLAGANTFTGQLQINGGYTVTLTGSLAHANIHLGRDTGAQAVLKGSGTINFNLGDPSNPASSDNDKMILDWGRDMPSENGTSVDTSLLLADGLTLALNINGSLDPALEYPLVTWETMFNATYGVLEQSGKILGEFTVTGLPAGWHLHYHGTVANPNGVILAYGEPAPVGDDGTGLKAEYFDNRSFEGVRVVESLESPYFNWGTAKPRPEITSADNFSVRWSGKIRALATGPHTFIVDHDDECRVIIDGQVLIRDSGWGVAMCTVDLVDDQLVDIVVELVEEGGNARCMLEWGSATMALQPIPLSQLYPVEIDHQGSGTGLAAKYFDNRHLDGDPVIERTEGPVNFDWGSGSPDSQLIPVDDFSIEWSGQLETPYDDDYTIKIDVDDGVIVWLDGKIVINKWYDGQPFTVSHTFTGEAGKKYPIRVAFYEHAGFAKIKMRWECAHFDLREIPQDRLYATQAFKVVLPESSITSPAFIEGAVPDNQHENIEIIAGGTDYDAIRLAKNSFFVDVALDPSTTPTPVSIGMTGDTPTTGDIIWTPTLLNSEDTVIVRKGDSLLIQTTPGATLTVYENCGVIASPLSVPASGLFEYEFATAGIFEINDGQGGTRNVKVVGIDYIKPIACQVGWERSIKLPLEVDSDDTLFTSADPSNLSVKEIFYDPATQLEELKLSALRRSTPCLLVRQGDEHGPVVWLRYVDEFTFETSAHDDLIFNKDYRIAQPYYKIHPHVPGLYLDLAMFASDSTFEGGATTLRVSTDDWEVIEDSVTGEQVGLYYLTLEIPENENQCCFRYKFVQNNQYDYQVSEEPNANPEIGCRVHGHKSLVFTRANDPEEDELYEESWEWGNTGNPEYWLKAFHSWIVYTGEEDDCGKMYRVLIDYETMPTNERRVDNPEPASYDPELIRQSSDPKECNGLCDVVMPGIYTGTISGKYDKYAYLYNGSRCPADSFWVSKLDLHGIGPSGTREKMPETAPLLSRRKGTVDEPVILIEKGGADGVGGTDDSDDCSLYGVIDELSNVWKLRAIARDPNDPENNDVAPHHYIKWSGVTVVNNGMSYNPIYVTYDEAGHYAPTFTVHKTSDDSIVGKASIHFIAVEKSRSHNVGTVYTTHSSARGAATHLTNYAGGEPVDAKTDIASVVSDPDNNPLEVVGRGRTSLDGYPQNEYWAKSEEDQFDLYQVVTVEDGKPTKVYLQGYSTASRDDDTPGLTDSEKLNVEVCGQAMLEIGCRSVQYYNKYWKESHGGPNKVDVEWWQTDIEQIHVFSFDLDIDSDNDNGYEDPDRTEEEDSIENDEEEIGKLIGVNDGDEDGDTVPDWADGIDRHGNGGDNASQRFAPLKFEVRGALISQYTAVKFIYNSTSPENVNVNDGVYSLGDEDEANAGVMRLWTKNGNESRKVAQIPGGNYIESEEEYPLSALLDGEGVANLYVEGIRPANKETITVVLAIDGDFSDETNLLKDVVKVSIVKLDLDIDSDNTKHYYESCERSLAEDQMEDSDEEEFTGRIICTNLDDEDGDGVPNFADGYTAKTYQNAGANAGGKFVPIELSLEGLSEYDEVNIDYPAANPQEISRTGSGVRFDPYIYTSTSDGRIRIWRKNGNESRDPKSINDDGDYIPPGDYTVGDLTENGNTLYVEGVKPSTDRADVRIVIKVTALGDIDNGYAAEMGISDAVKSTLVEYQLVVDNNRNHKLLDFEANRTSTMIPYLFWVNDDTDYVHGSSDIYGPYTEFDDATEDVTSVGPNNSDDIINTQRDLEDFARISLSLSNDDLIADIRTDTWRNNFEHSDSTGGSIKYAYTTPGVNSSLSYLTDEGDSLLQISKGLMTDPSSGFEIERVYTRDIIEDGKFYGCSKIPMIFEGSKGGGVIVKAKLTRNGKIVGQYRSYIKLLGINKFYSWYSVGECDRPWDNPGDPVNGIDHLIAPAAVATRLNQADQSTYQTDNPVSVHVHGWNMTTEEKTIFFETHCKRLWWNNFRGHQVYFSWPTDNRFGEGIQASWDSRNYDRSEYAAWQSGKPLADFIQNTISSGALSDTHDGRIVLSAHSMGNVVACEASKVLTQRGRANMIDSYLALMAAVPVQVIDPNAGLVFNWEDYEHPVGLITGEADMGPDTADVYKHYLPSEGIAGNLTAARRIINYQNQNDFALSEHIWGLNQKNKPTNDDLNDFGNSDDDLMLWDSDYPEVITTNGTRLGYVGKENLAPSGTTESPEITPQEFYDRFHHRTISIVSNTYQYRVIPWSGGGIRDHVYITELQKYGLGADNLEIITISAAGGDGTVDYTKNRHFIMAFMSESRRTALGATVNVSPTIATSVNLQSLWPDDKHENPARGAYGGHPWHSAMWRMAIYEQNDVFKDIARYRLYVDEALLLSN